MSRPIFSRPRTRVYGCNYDKGESYYKPMVDHLDRKYSSRPLFSEPRTSFADEIASRRSDIGTRSVGASRLEDFFDDLDNNEATGSIDEAGTPDYDDEHDDETNSGKDFALARRRAKQRANEAFERDLEELRKRRRDMQDKMFDMIDMNAEMEIARSCLEGANRAFMKHATKFDNSAAERRIAEPDETRAKSRDDNARVSRVSGRAPLFRWTRMEEIERDPPGLISGVCNRRTRIDSIAQDENSGELGMEHGERHAVPRDRAARRTSLTKRKKSVSF